MVGVLLGVGVWLGVRVMVAVGVILGVSVFVGVKVGVEDFVGVFVEDGVIVSVGVGEGVSVGVGVENMCSSRMTPEPNPAANSTIPMRRYIYHRFMGMIFIADWNSCKRTVVHPGNRKSGIKSGRGQVGYYGLVFFTSLRRSAKQQTDHDRDASGNYRSNAVEDDILAGYAP